MGYIFKFIRSLFSLGFRETMRRVKYFLRRRYNMGNRRAFKRFVVNIMPSESELARQRAAGGNIKFSILTPLYNTDEQHLKAMIESVLAQSYANWQLCLADGSDGDGQVQRICEEYGSRDRRISYRRLERNEGISGNTNRCLELAQGDYISLLDHDDILHPSALYEAAQAIQDRGADFVYTDESLFTNDTLKPKALHLKPDFAPDTLRSYNYICHFSSFSRALLDRVGNFRSECDGSQDYDMFLRLTEAAKNIAHIPKVLYFWREHEGSTSADVAAKPYAIEAAHTAISGQLQRLGLEGQVLDTRIPSCYRINYAIHDNPMVSIIIPNRDCADMLEQCINSILDKSTYDNYEILIIENGSTQRETQYYYDEIGKNKRIRVLVWEEGFNFSAINNYGAKQAGGEYILLLNNDTQVISPDWIQQMLMFGQREDVGAVGALLLYPDDTVQHAGVILGIGGVAGHSHKGYHRDDFGYMSRLCIAQNLSAVTGACMLVKRSLWDSLGGLDEGYAVAFNDVDLCMRIRRMGKLVVFTPFAQLYHYESKSRGYDDVAREKRERFLGEVERFKTAWKEELEAGDAYYNPGLSLELEDFSLG